MAVVAGKECDIAQRGLAILLIAAVAIPLPWNVASWGLTLFPFTLVLLLLLFGWFLRRMLGTGRAGQGGQGIDRVLVALLFFISAAAVSAMMNGASFRHAFLWLYLAGLFAFARYRLPRLLGLDTVIRVVCLVLLVVAAICLVQFLTASSFGVLYKYFPDPNEKLGQVYPIGGGILKRVQGPFFGSNILAQFMTYCLVWLAAVSRARRSPLVSVTIGAVATTILLTFSRSTWVIAPLGITVGLLLLFRNRLLPPSRVITAFFVLLAAGSIAALIIPDTWLSRFDVERVEESTQARLKPVEAALEVIQQDPLFGVGYANFKDAVYERLGIRVENRPHNIYVQVFAEQGVLAGIVFFSMIALLALEPRGMNARDRTSRTLHVSVQAMVVVWLAFMVIYATANDYAVTPVIMLLAGYSLSSQLARAPAAGRPAPVLPVYRPPRRMEPTSA